MIPRHYPQIEDRYSVVPIISEKYWTKSKRKHEICSAVFSPTFFGVLMLFRDGRVNWSGSAEHESLMEVADGERLEKESQGFRGTNSMAFSKDGMRALGVDRRGKVLALESKRFTAQNLVES
jgi:hypothetical protein